MAPRFPPSPLPIAAHAGGNWSLLLHSQGRIAIQAGQGILTSIFFADKVSTHIHPWRTKEHDRTVCLHRHEATLWRKAQNDHSVLTSPPATFSGKDQATLQSHLLVEGSKAFHESTEHSWQHLSYLPDLISWSGSTTKEMRQRGHVLPGWDQALPALLIPNVFPPAISSHHLSVKLHRFISSVTVFFICFFLQHISEA